LNQHQLASQSTKGGIAILITVSAAHLLNDAIQAAVPSSFPMLQEHLQLSYAQIGWSHLP
jgi:MFS transporter, FSR family, fosmidomycin resistance protein